MSWKPSFTKAIAQFKAGNNQEAVDLLTQAINHGGQEQYILYDSRAAALERISRKKDALLDAKKVIYLVPSKWHGYSRAAKIFLSAFKYEEALKMVELALERLDSSTDKTRVSELSSMRSDILAHRLEHGYHFGCLPLEVCGEIFTLLVADTPKNLFSILRVSRNWNSVACGTHHLWATLSLDVKKPAWKAKRWIQCSQGLIKELILPEQLERSDWTHDHLRGLKWDQLQSCCLTQSSLLRYLQRHDLIPSLRNLENLTLLRQANDDIAPLFKPLLDTLPLSLRSLRVQEGTWDWFGSLTNLTCLDLDGPGHPEMDTLFTILQNNPCLEKLSLRLFYPYYAPDHQDSIPLHSLRHFEVDHGSHIQQLLSRITMPNLQTFKLIGPTALIDSGLGYLFNSELPSLQVFHIEASIFQNPQIVISCLKNTPNVKDLALIQVTEVAGPLLESLVSTSEDSLSLSLERLNITGCPDVKGGQVVRFVKSTLHPKPEAPTDLASNLLHLVMNKCPQVEPEVLPWLRQYVPYVSCLYQSKKEASWRR